MKKVLLMMILAMAGVIGTQAQAAAPKGAPKAKVSKVVPRGIAIEEYTGTGCGYCPRGLVGMENLRAKYGKRFVGVAYHGYNPDDPMYIEDGAYDISFSGAPSCDVNRAYGADNVDPYYGVISGGNIAGIPIDDLVDEQLSVPATAGIKLNGAWNADNTKVTATATIESVADGGDYTIQFMLIADGLTGKSSAWKQANYYNSDAVSSLPDDMKFLSGIGDYYFTTFNDVCIATSMENGKNKATAPGKMDDGDVKTISYTLTMPTKRTLLKAIDFDKVAVVALLINAEGEVANAAKYYMTPQPVEPVDIADGDYYLQNVATNQFLAAGHSWGTRSILNQDGLDFTITAADGKYTLDSHVANNATNHFLGENLFVDAASYSWTFAKAGDAYTIGGLFGGDEQYLAAGANNETVLSLVDNKAAQWKLVTYEERLAGLEKATADSPADATFVIKDANFNRNDQRRSAWTMEASNQNLSGGNNENNCAESWHSAFSLSQTINGLPNGVYELTAQGFWRQDGEDNDNLPYFFVNGQKATFPKMAGTENSMADASVSFTSGLYTIEPIRFVVNDGSITLGAKNDANLTIWCIWDNFRLTYFGPEQAPELADGKYYLVNIASGKTWGAGNSWGTQASLVEHPEYVTLLKQPDGTYFLESQVSNGGTSYYFNGDFMDNDKPVNLTITPVEVFGQGSNGQSVWSYTIANGTNYYGYDGETTVLGKNLDPASENALWIIATEEDVKAGLAEATFVDPVDATFLLLDPGFGRNNRNKSAWTGDDFAVGGDNTNMNAEKWGGNSKTFDISQTVEAPNGKYLISWNGYYRYNNTTDNTNDIAIAAHADGSEVINSFVYINGVDYPLTSIADEAASAALEGALPFSQTDASNAFAKGLYAHAATVEVTDGKLTVGIKKTNHPGCDWTVWDNFEILYYGEGKATPDDPELVAPEGWENVIANGNLAGDDVSNFLAKEAPSTDIVGATIVPGAGKNGSRGLVVKSQDKVSQPWDSQFFIRFNQKLPEGTKLHVEFDYMADLDASIGTQSHGEPGGYQHWAAIGNVNFTSDWQHFTADVNVEGAMADMQSIAFNLNDLADANTYCFDNFGIWIEKPAPVDEWVDILTNGGMEGNEVVNFFSKEAPSNEIVPSTIVDGIGVDGSRGIQVTSIAGATNDWDSQFWIYLPFILPEGTKYKAEFDYKASIAGSADTQAHGEPGNYIHWSMIGSPAFTTEWQHYEKEGTISADQAEAKTDGVPNGNKFRSIAFNLSKDKANDVTFYFDNVKFFVEKDFYETGIRQLTTEQLPAQGIYNLRGQKVEKLTKGLYIINGKKVVVK